MLEVNLQHGRSKLSGLTLHTFGPADNLSSIVFDHANRLVLWELAGSNRISAVMEQLVQLVEHPEFDRSYGILVDPSKATFRELRLNDMIAVFDVTRSNRGGRRAIVLRGASLRRLFDFFMLIRGDDGKVRSFESREDALDWLGHRPKGAATETGSGH